MTPATLKTLITLVAITAGAAMLVPQLLPYQAALSALSAGLLGWVHGKRPGDMTETQADDAIEAAVTKQVESEK